MKMNKYVMLMILILIIGLLAFTACDKRNFELNYVIARMTANPDTIYADNNITYSEIEVLVKNDEGHAITNEPVQFVTNIGNILSQVSTDSMGVATTSFWDAGQHGNAHIQATVGTSSKTIDIFVADIPPIQSLVLDVNSTEFNVNEVTLIRAEAMYPFGPVPDGTYIVFETTEGHFQADLEGQTQGSSQMVATANGIAEVYWNTGLQSGTATLTASLTDQSDTAEITITPGPPRYMTLTPDVTEIPVSSGDVVIGARPISKHPHFSPIKIKRFLKVKRYFFMIPGSEIYRSEILMPSS